MNTTTSPLGKKSSYTGKYNNTLIFPISRSVKRAEINIKKPLPFFGYDILNAYEIAWLRKDGRPEVAMAEIIYHSESEFIIESKSLKLYLNSFNDTIFDSAKHLKSTMERDLSNKIKAPVSVKLLDVNSNIQYAHPVGINIDDFYFKEFKGGLAAVKNTKVQKEQLFTNLLKSNCPVTLQPDWGTLMINYSGIKINYASLLHYILSMRNFNEFHEQCVEKIYMDINNFYNPEFLEVYARYTRRGGIDINPYRCSSKQPLPKNHRFSRQ
jgi:7-cyano-7-deazaguanine reductase